MHMVGNPGERVVQIFAKTRGGGGSRLSDKIASGVPNFGFYCIFINKFCENYEELSFYPPSPCASIVKKSFSYF